MKRSNPSLVTLSCVLATLLMAGCNDNHSPAPAAVSPAPPRGPITTAEFLDHLRAQAAHDPEAHRLLLALTNPVPPNPPVSDPEMDQCRQFLIGLIATQSTDPRGNSVNSEEDWRKGAHEAPPAWTGTPFALVDGVRVKTRAALEGLRGPDNALLATEVVTATQDTATHRYIPFEMAGTPSDPLAPGQDALGLNPRNMMVNRYLGARHAHREAMPAGLANPRRTIHVDGDATRLTPAATEWINVHYRTDERVDHILTPAEAATFVRTYYGTTAAAEPLSYADIMYNAIIYAADEEGLAWDPLGRPLNPNPRVNDIGITGQGSYFRLGPNKSIDVLVTVKHNGRIYGVFTQRNEPGVPLSFPGGMDDLTEVSKFDTVLRELGEETGIELNKAQLVAGNKITTAWAGPVATDTRQTRNAWTVTTLYHVHFDNVAEMATYGAVHADFDEHEVANRSLVDLAYVIPTYLAPNHPSHMLASHRSMLSFALGKFLSADPEEMASLMQPMQGPTLNDNQIAFRTLRHLLQEAATARSTAEAAGSDSSSHHSGDDAASHHSGDDAASHHSGDDAASHHSGDDAASHHSGDDAADEV